jgi:hypothetical protein
MQDNEDPTASSNRSTQTESPSVPVHESFTITRGGEGGQWLGQLKQSIPKDRKPMASSAELTMFARHHERAAFPVNLETIS